jgi:hypothetical protein
VAIGHETTCALCAQLEMVPPSRSTLSQRLHVSDSQIGVCSLIEERFTGRYVPFCPEGVGSQPASYRDFDSLPRVLLTSRLSIGRVWLYCKAYPAPRVAYLGLADKYFGPLPTRLRSVNRPPSRVHVNSGHSDNHRKTQARPDRFSEPISLSKINRLVYSFGNPFFGCCFASPSRYCP